MSERIENPGPGLHREFSYDEYASWPGLRKSTLWPIVVQTPAHYLYQLSNPKESTSAMTFGTAVHTKVLEPGRFTGEYGTGPINDKTGRPYGSDTQAAKKWKRETGKEMISETDMDNLNGMAASVFAHEAASALLAKAECEISMVWEDEVTGVLLQGRLDLWLENAVLFGDLKTTGSAHPRAFTRDAIKYGYFAQAAMYYDGVSTVTGQAPYKPQFIVVEKTPPYVVAIYEIETCDLQYGRDQYRKALGKIAKCESENHWPGYPKVMPLPLPKWANTEEIYD